MSTRQYGTIDDGSDSTLIVRSQGEDTGEWSNWEYVSNSADLPEFVLEDLPQPSDD